MNKIKVLLVDDHAIMRDGIRALLSIHDDIKIVGEASEGQEAIEKTQDLSPDVVVMDVAMPDMDGIEVARRSAWFVKRIHVSDNPPAYTRIRDHWNWCWPRHHRGGCHTG